ncbi:farnesyl-diphosphate farnesyltransferase [Nitzschia inconspicua]|uniref:Farnesyl-diphosphate farnesyltransferase n=1 Tax=Nitzschia inconspicua TaxID=303405 RepID=A0A9K3LTF1_9STRA|nr:farnesyl-diphosphate farnesyltransferase [Nitzschia inconspicua]
MTTTSKLWDGNAMSQEDMMIKDTVLVLDDNDNVIGSASKRSSHEFTTDQPRAILHRAFSVFLFDESTGELLLQQRASTKITFPNVWTNTCCSHPLHGMEPSEVDSPEDVANGSVLGAKYAAIRKLDHELGIPAKQLPIEKFKFLTRLHYWAADTVTHGNDSPWGEHEIDYVLFFCVKSKDELTIKPHPDEVDACKWVTRQQLIDMMDDPELLFSPWFRLICKKWLLDLWWKDLDTTMTTDKYCDFVQIHCFDPPKEHLGGGGNAGLLFEDEAAGDKSKKQGAYGKIKTHKESLFKQLLHVDEVFAALYFLYVKPLKSNLETPYIRDTFDANDLAFCDDILVKVSRSFAAVIQQLPSTMLVDILVFYLVLRALDTIEDDTSSFPSQEVKIKYLLNFHKTALADPTWTMDGVGEADEKRLLQNFDKCHRVYAKLNEKSRRVISDIAQRMATGMAEFVGKDLGQGTTDIDQYNRYCHFVAGLVGEGLSRLFAASGLEKPSLASELFLSDQMGLFLQKTNIIRDYLEDYVDHRAFWPQTIWMKYAKSGELGYFTNQQDPEVRECSLACLNELVTDALKLAPDCLNYMSKLQCTEIFRFCAIPQVMAISTLDYCYANSNVFTGVVKIRKGTSCKLILRTNNLEEVHDTFYQFAQSILNKANVNRALGVDDPSYARTVKICETVMETTAQAHNKQKTIRRMKMLATVGVLVGCTATFFKDDISLKIPSGILPSLIPIALGVHAYVQYKYTQPTGLTDAKVLEQK